MTKKIFDFTEFHEMRKSDLIQEQLELSDSYISIQLLVLLSVRAYEFTGNNNETITGLTFVTMSTRSYNFKDEHGFHVTEYSARYGGAKEKLKTMFAQNSFPSLVLIYLKMPTRPQDKVRLIDVVYATDVASGSKKPKHFPGDTTETEGKTENASSETLSSSE